MRRAILSDIHGNYRALQAVLEDIEKREVDDIITLGDNVGYGPEPEQVVLELAARNIESVMGNHEFALINPNYYHRLNFLAQESLDITRTLLSEKSVSWLAHLKPVIIRNNARFCHGCPPCSITKYLYAPSIPRLTRLFQDYPEKLCFCGHTHMLNIFMRLHTGEIKAIKMESRPISLDQKNRYLIIVGSVGQPRDNLNNKAKYVLWDNNANTCRIHQVPYDVETTVALLKSLKFPIHNAQRLKWSKKKK